VHGRPAHTNAAGVRLDTTNGGLWNSNGPVYVSGVFDMWTRIFLDVVLLSTLLAGLANPALTKIANPSDVSLETFVAQLMDWHPQPGVPPVAARIAEHLMPSNPAR
jgi:hypothetical protein